MVQQGQRLALGLEAGDDLLGVHARLDDFEGHPPPDGFQLLGHEHHAKAALADWLEQFVTSDDGARPFSEGRFPRIEVSAQGVLLQELTDLLAGLEQRFDPLAKFGFIPAGGVEVAGALFQRAQGQGLKEDRPHVIGLFAHHLLKRRPGSGCRPKLASLNFTEGNEGNEGGGTGRGVIVHEIFVTFVTFCSIHVFHRLSFIAVNSHVRA